jgi:hypothetical protein
MRRSRTSACRRQEVDEVNMLLSSRFSDTQTFRRDGTMRASELSRRLRNEVRRSPRPAARFAELLRGSTAKLPLLEFEPSLRVTLNPIRAWLHEGAGNEIPGHETPGHEITAPTRMKGAAPAPIPTPGADVVLFTVGEEVRTFPATMPQRALLHQLAEIGPATLDAWLAHDSALGRLGATRRELVELIRETTAAGLTAVS